MGRRKTKEEWKIHGNVFDAFTERIIFKLESQGFYKRLISAYKIGKESNVFLAETKEKTLVAVKIYRLENCNFNKMYDYLIQDERFINLKGQRRKIIFSWVQREYRNLLKAREAIRVPIPLTIKDHVLVMEMIGDDEPAQQLKDLIPKKPEEFFDEIITSIKKLYEIGLVHGDLSAFNILNHHEEPIFIDFSQSTTTKSPGHKELLQRDINNICKFFERLNISRKPKEIYDYVVKENEDNCLR